MNVRVCFTWEELLKFMASISWSEGWSPLLSLTPWQEAEFITWLFGENNFSNLFQYGSQGGNFHVTEHEAWALNIAGMWMPCRRWQWQWHHCQATSCYFGAREGNNRKLRRGEIFLAAAVMPFRERQLSNPVILEVCKVFVHWANKKVHRVHTGAKHR